jgi:serine/threonine-protein kinase
MTAVPESTPELEPVYDPAPEDRGSPWPIVLLVIGLVAAIVLILWLVLRDSGGDDEPDATDTSSSAPTSSAPTTEDTPSEPSSSAPAPVEIDESDYVGRNVDEVVADLRDLGLRVDTQPVDNPGDEEADTVSSVSPTSGLVEGDTVTVEYFREPEPTTPPPSSDTSTPSPSPSDSSSPPPSPTTSASQAEETPTASDSAAAPRTKVAR